MVRLDVQAKDKPDRSGTPVIQLGKIEAWMERKNDPLQSDRNVRRFASHSVQHSRLFVRERERAPACANCSMRVSFNSNLIDGFDFNVTRYVLHSLYIT